MGIIEERSSPITMTDDCFAWRVDRLCLRGDSDVLVWGRAGTSTDAVTAD